MLQHVALELDPREVPRARKFWQLVGMVEVEPPESLRGRTVWLQAPAPGSPATQIHLMLTDDSVVPPAGHAAFHVPDFTRTVSRLREAGFEVLDREPHWGVPRAFAIHPGGHRVELMEHPPPPSESGL